MTQRQKATRITTTTKKTTCVDQQVTWMNSKASDKRPKNGTINSPIFTFGKARSARPRRSGNAKETGS